jgi:WD40 repeat protein
LHFLISFNIQSSRPKVIDLRASPHVSPEKATMKGISCVAPYAHPQAEDTDTDRVHPYFFSGGYDKSVYLWSLSKTQSGYKSRTPTQLERAHTASVYAVAGFPSRNWVLSGGADARLVTCDLETNQVLAGETVQFEARNEVHQIHTTSSQGQLVFLEVNTSRVMSLSKCINGLFPTHR